MNRFCASRSIGATSASGSTSQPRRQPVMLKYLLKLLTETMCSPSFKALSPKASS